MAGKFFVNMQEFSFISAPNPVALSRTKTWIRRDIPLQLPVLGTTMRNMYCEKISQSSLAENSSRQGAP